MPSNKSAGRNTSAAALVQLVRRDWQNQVCETYLPRICESLKTLSEDDIWWRPNPASNSVGNMVLHLSGNVRQWIISGLGGAKDLRQRDLEFSETGPLPRADLTRKLQSTVNEAARVIAKLTPAAFMRHYHIQGYQVTGYEAANHVAIHFALHAGQIIYVAKMKSAKDLGFTHVPAAPLPAKRKVSGRR